MSKLFNEAEVQTIFRSVTGHSACGPSDVNSAAPAVTAPAVDGRGVHISHAFVGPLRKHDSGFTPALFCMTGTGIDCDVVRPDFIDPVDDSFVSQALDAPDMVLSGSMACQTYGKFSCGVLTRSTRGFAS